MSSKVAEITQILSEAEIQKRVSEMADRISRDYSGKKPILVGILKGSYMFLADLTRKIEVEHEIDFMMVSSYDNDPHESGNVKLMLDLSRNISGEDVIIVEDIVDSGKTLNYIYHNLLMRKPKSLEIVTLLDKAERREIAIDIKYVGFEIPNRFVIGYGLDDAGMYRGLPFIAYRNEKG
ncbi:MAG: hypoxanthine phosphoribosyltransferase [candidate division Zixibacteria bacterium]|nr:hypoxanthine phosphoribosyltransferase [candidate division Zixibacteria bacterium]NIR68114.1 hypoxanthine phosphoribosyltransferase [candidate division Zixibacteria bacterium]NIS17751.1 hypoxanthine phosphoribosyltransferase [candidate division Zixibacteria bacterium]NIS49325.1 hypoxanthine phosphoribosyltransferase [candidate division Zixibacteria bacterium]NIT54071.1 hypoxanthine phosphoribosyltransferase [candidate division Zixibacteria bacterium]